MGLWSISMLAAVELLRVLRLSPSTEDQTLVALMALAAPGPVVGAPPTLSGRGADSGKLPTLLTLALPSAGPSFAHFGLALARALPE